MIEWQYLGLACLCVWIIAAGCVTAWFLGLFKIGGRL